MRPIETHPTLLSTSRHVTQGMVDVTAEKWEPAAGGLAGTLSGSSKIVGGDNYEIRIALPPASPTWKAVGAQLSSDDRAAGATVKVAEAESGARVSIASPTDREVTWKVMFNSVRRDN
jgi:hypothetical protein